MFIIFLSNSNASPMPKAVIYRHPVALAVDALVEKRCNHARLYLDGPLKQLLPASKKS